MNAWVFGIFNCFPAFIYVTFHGTSQPDRDLFHLYYQVVEADYFQSLGFTARYYDKAVNKFDKRAIKKAISRIMEDNRAYYPNLNPATGSLRFDSLPEFARSYLLMVRNLEMVKTD